ncbi:anti-virulence regulator CigR family protein [Pantoea anthophila]|uniref:anti-virulence regulator CigR family protein n=1 Tax=Pantoea anthophila TaxID=470931 RepID=UPI00289B4E57|nr:anti-virulence regulator CigR family protein [Pantoea anthophila]
MFKQRTLKAAVALVIGFAVCAAPVYANPGNGNGNGNGNGHDADINFSRARSLAVNYGLVGYQSLPPGIAKKVARGKPLPPGIAKKALPASMLNDLPYYPGYEWRAVGDDLVLIALSTAIVTAVINGVFD